MPGVASSVPGVKFGLKRAASHGRSHQSRRRRVVDLVAWDCLAESRDCYRDEPAMNRAALAVILTLVGLSSGCSMCCGPMDYAYPTHGGKWERADRYHGRVASAFYDASAGQITDEVVVEDGVMEETVVEGEMVEEVIVEEGETVIE